MRWLSRNIGRKVIVLSLVVLLASFIAFPSRQVAQETSIFSRVQRLFSRPKSAPRTPPEADGAGRGPACTLAKNAFDTTQGQLIRASRVLLPPEIDRDDDDQPNAKYLGSATVSERPTFWFYIPYVTKAASGSQAIQVAQFTLLDEVQTVLWQEFMAFELLQSPQLIEYSLPYSLVVDRPYSWYFSVVCDPEMPSKNATLRGWVQRSLPTPELQAALRGVDLAQGAGIDSQPYRIYRNSGLWLDAVSALAQSRRQFPAVERFRAQWDALLSSLGIPPLSQLDALTPTRLLERQTQ